VAARIALLVRPFWDDSTVHPRRKGQLVTMFVLSLAAAMGLLVVWIVYVARSGSRLLEAARQFGGRDPGFPWIILTVGCVLFFFLIVGLSYQLAQALAARSYVQKQDEFVANVTHELKSPLAAIKLQAQTLLRLDELPVADRRRSLGYIEQHVDRMASLVDDVLESSRLVAKKRAVQLEPVDLSGFVEAYVREAGPRARSHGVHLMVAADDGLVVRGTELGLRRVLDNLIDNAVRFSEPGGEVRFSAREEAPWAVLEIEDDGVGIPKKELERIFDRFYQASTRDLGGSGDSAAGDPGRTGRWRGTGLGLAIVAGLVEEMRGTVHASSNEGQPGSRFIVRLPLEGGR
jgi:signal transduction histidine kinase